MVSIEAFSELLHVLYAAPLQQEQWQRFLALVSHYTCSQSGYFLSADTRTGLAILAEGGKAIGETTISSYNNSYARRDPFRRALFVYSRNASAVGVFTDEDLLPNEGLLRTDLYRDLLGPSNLRHGAFTILALSVRRFDAISIWRSPEEGPMATDSMRLLELLIPHVQTALEVRRVLGATQQRLASAEAMANASSTATFVLNRHGNIVHSNTAAQSLVRDEDGLMIVKDRLTACEHQSSADLSKLLREVSSPSCSLSRDESSRFIALQRTSSMRPLQAMATSLPETFGRSAGAILLLVTDPDKSFTFPDDALRALYRFTAAEAEVANGMLMGYSAEEVACLRRVSAATVRQQIKSMMNKTGTKRQGEMVRLLTTLPHADFSTA
jgi:DNA-binding CsgD family transcriptional regulator/PAS domain-containing protein